MRWGILGTLLVADDAGIPIPLPAGRLSVLLAALLTRPNHVVSVDELVDILWDGEPPAGAARTVRVYVVRLRQALGPAAERIVTKPPGYLCRAAEHELDLLRFHQLCGQARSAARDQDWSGTAALLGEALDLWRGTPFEDVASQVLRDRELPRLDQLRMQAVEDRIEAELRLHRYTDLVPRLTELTERFPLREHLHAQLMRALAGAGRRAEALQAYQRARRSLVEQLGIEPGPELRAAHQRVLADQPETTGTTAKPPSTPRQLPAAVRDFIGRRAELDMLTGMLEQASVVLISAIDGMAGIGKTTLAVHWAHQVADRFPDGQLYIDLLGYTPDEPMRPADALARFLRALGMSDREIPEEPNERAACYRSLVAGRRVLVILDNAWTAEQARPLLPGSASCAAVVTSRDSLAGLVARDGARRIALDLLSPAEAGDLLRALIGARAGDEPAATAKLAEQCGQLPLALRIAAEFVSAHPDRTLAEVIADLDDHRNRLDLLDAGGDQSTAPRTVFSWSYRHLEPDAARLFRLFGLQPGTLLDRAAAAALCDIEPARTGLLLDRLARAHLVQPAGSGRYRMHDLLRDYARELAVSRDDEPARHTALTRLFDHYTHTVAAAVDTALPGRRRGAEPPGDTFADAAAASNWLDTRHPALLQIVSHTAGNGWPGQAIRLGIDLSHFLTPRGSLADSAAICRHALAAARAIADRRGEADALTRLGVTDWWRGRYAQAADSLRQAGALARAAGDDFGETLALGNLGLVEESQGKVREAAEHYRAAVRLLDKAGDRRRMAVMLSNLGALLRRLGEYPEATEHYRAALAICREVGDKGNLAQTLGRLGSLALYQRRFAEAADDLGQAVALFQQISDRSGEANATLLLGEIDIRFGRFAQADERLSHAQALCQDTGDRPTEIKVLCRIGLAELARDRIEPATRQFRAALELARELGQPAGEAEALNGLGEVSCRAGDPEQARAHHTAALRAAIQAGYVEEQQRARARLDEGSGTGAERRPAGLLRQDPVGVGDPVTEQGAAVAGVDDVLDPESFGGPER